MKRVGRPKQHGGKDRTTNNYRWGRIARRRLGQQSCTGGISVLGPYMPDTGKVRM